MSEAATTTSLPAGFGAAPMTPALLEESQRVQDALIGPMLDAVLRDQVPRVSFDLAAAASGGGDATTFKLHSNKDGLEIRVGATPTTTLVIVKGECIVPASVYELREFISGHSTLEFNTMMHESDVMFMDGRVMRRYEGRGSEFDATGINIPARLASVLPCRHDVWSVFRLPFPLWARDFVFMEAIHRVFVDAAGAWRLAAAGTEPGPSEREFVLTISNSCVREDCGDLEKSNSFVRGLVALAGYVVTAAPDSTAAAPKSILTYVNLADAKGSIPDFVQKLVAPDQGQNPGRIRDIFTSRRKAEQMLSSAVPVEMFRNIERGIIAKLVSIARGTVHTRTVNLPAGASLVVWSTVEYKRVAVTVDVTPAAAGPIAFTKSDGTGASFANGDKVEAGIVLTSRVGPATAPCTVNISWSNAGLHLSAKVVAFAMEVTTSAAK